MAPINITFNVNDNKYKEFICKPEETWEICKY